MRRNANFNTIIFVFRLMFFQKHTCLVEFCYAKFIAARHNIEIPSCFSLFCARLVEFSKRLAEISASTADFRGMRLCVSGCDKGRFFSIREELQSVCEVSRMVKQKTPPTACVVGGAMKGGPEWAFLMMRTYFL